MNRIYRLLLLGSLIVAPLNMIAQKANVVRIGMCTDVHLPTMHDAEYRITTFIDYMKKK